MMNALKRPLFIAFAVFLLAPQIAAGATDKELQHQRGDVRYQDGGGQHAVSGSIALPDNARAITGRRSLALLAMPDSSEIQLGENTDIAVGAFNTTAAGPGSTITVNNGALKFKVSHPTGGRSNYTFATPTSQIAVRGTEGYLVVGPKGTQVVCTKCEPGDVTVTVAGVVTALLTGQVFTALGSGATTTTAVASSSTLNSPAVNQFSSGANPLGGTGATSDVTASASGASAGAAAGVSAGVAAGAVAATAAVAVAAANSPAPAASSGPSNGPVAITPSSLRVRVGEQQMVNAPPDASATSSNPAVAAVYGSGGAFFVRAGSAGSATITLRSETSVQIIQVTVEARH